MRKTFNTFTNDFPINKAIITFKDKKMNDVILQVGWASIINKTITISVNEEMNKFNLLFDNCYFNINLMPINNGKMSNITLFNGNDDSLFVEDVPLYYACKTNKLICNDVGYYIVAEILNISIDEDYIINEKINIDKLLETLIDSYSLAHYRQMKNIHNSYKK